MTYVQLEDHEHQPVEVRLDDGIWVAGVLETYRQVEGVWSGYVRYTVAAGDTRHGWFEEPRIRGHAPR